MPTFIEPSILGVEADELAKEHTLHEFIRNLESLLHLPGARESVQGLLIGRFESASNIDDNALGIILRTKFPNIPIIANVDFGHTIPMLSLPIGGKVSIEASKVPQLTILPTPVP